VLSEERARELAEESIRSDGLTLASDSIESDRGWYFHWNERMLGVHGLVVNKETGSVFVLGSSFPLERDLRMYDRGMDAERHDLVITAVADLDETVALLQRIAPTIVEPCYENGSVWRIPRCLTQDELRIRMATLPAVFPDVQLYFEFEAIVEARSSGCCIMELFPRLH
jgi:hypothetical protein